MSRRFEFAEGSSKKFWAGGVDGKTLNVRWGRLGTPGQAQTKTFPSPDGAQKELEKLIREKTKKGYVEVAATKSNATKAGATKAGATKAGATKKAGSPSKASANVPLPPWERAGRERRFEGHRVAFSGKLAALEKDKVVAMLAAEGATVDEAVGKGSTLFVFSVAGSANHKRAQKMQQEGANLLVVSEDDFRRRYILPTEGQCYEMLLDTKARKRLANLLELNRKAYSRSTDEYSEVRLERRSLHGASLANASLCGVFFIECDLREADLANAEWLAGATKTDFRAAKGKNLEIWDARDCDFRACDLPGVRLRSLEGCRFEEATLTKCNMSDLTDCRFDGATLDGFDASYGELKGCSFEKVSAQKAELTEATFRDCRFVGADFRGANIKGDSDPVFQRCDLRKADFRGAVLSRVKLAQCDLTGARFEGATLIDVELVDTDATKATGLDLASPAKGPARQAIEAAAPTFKNIEVGVKLRVGSRKQECTLYQFNHGTRDLDRQAWLNGEKVGALSIADAIAAIAKLRPGARVDEASLVVKSSKGKNAPALQPKGLETAILEAWREALT